ncbi:CocE/NonD family hydrolase [Natronomonas gomsonensis]|uniref:CocE/NonD family hydrolase n=1 Tax=Natronomonas gomsonensis TaxID=1046043 RepID=UPI0020CA658F|nr:CocE/NonD family hydrolase [Natronomonas gomsonensis]MCY4732092.1 CocE/NonD family hydrolase [Natronomonas gomsonensis]
MQRRRFLGVLGAGTLGLAAATPATAELEYTETDVRIESFDGTEIAATLFEPAKPGRYPVVLGTHGWGGSRSASIGRNYAPRGYVVLSYDSRGFGESEGEVGVDGPKEVADVSALIDWLEGREKVRVEGENGASVGMIGGSYAGGIQLNAAAVDDRIEAIVPRIAWHDLNYSLQPNGVVKTVWGTGLYGVGIAGSRTRVVAEDSSTETRVNDASRGIDPAVHRSYAEGIALNGYSQPSQAFFAARSPYHKMDELDVPALFVQGWTDHLFVPNEAIWNFEAFRNRGRDAKLIMYNGGHAQIPVDSDPQQAESARDEATRAWLAEHLDSRDDASVDAVFDDHDVLVYESQTERMRGANAIPQRNAETVELDLSEGASIPEDAVGASLVGNTVAPTANSYVVSESFDGATSVAFEFDASDAFGLDDGQQADLLTVPEIDLQVRTLGTEATLFFRVTHVSEDGEETHINDNVTPLRIEDTPEAVHTETLELIAFQRYVSSGDTLRLVIDSTDSGFNSARESAGAIVEHDSTLRIPGVTVLDGSVV